MAILFHGRGIMQIERVEIQNFRLLQEVSLGLEAETTLIVGRNNCGKTSIAEVFRRLLSDKTPSFKLEDFSLGCHEEFWSAFCALHSDPPHPDILALLPKVQVTLDVSYDVTASDLGLLSESIVDLDPDCSFVRIVLTYGPKPTALDSLFDALPSPVDGSLERPAFFSLIKARLASSYDTRLEAVDPNDPTNRKELELRYLTNLIRGGFINAQRGLDDDTHRERDVLGKVVEVLFQSALTDPTDPQKRTIAEELHNAVEKIQKDLHDGFNAGLTSLLPTFELFGYPGLDDPGLTTVTTFDVERLLKDHTQVRYQGVNGLTLPESYNGLGVRNLVYILLQLLRFFREFQATPAAASVHLIFIEEPEAHLHPQMQEVFIRQLHRIKEEFERQLNNRRPWPVQFVISTHSPHMANEARFETMRYFLSTSNEHGLRQSRIKDLRQGMGDISLPDRNFLYQYLTLTRCDLFFADKAILIEGTSERLLLPTMIAKTDAASEAEEPKLASQYVTVMEVGGAYAHRFHKLLSFLELRTLIVTDIDSVKPNENNKRTACPVAEGQFTSNGCLKDWFEPNVSPGQLLAKTSAEKTKGTRQLAYQIPEQVGGPSGRSFEDAFVLANLNRFNLGDGDIAFLAYEYAADQKKSEFALKYAIEDTDWVVPRYIAEGLRWLAGCASIVNGPLLGHTSSGRRRRVVRPSVPAERGDDND